MDVREAVAERRPVAQVAALVALTKPRQSLLLLVTAVGAYALTLPGALSWPTLLLGAVALLLAVSGCTALNMVLDRDIDSKMARTAGRPLPSGDVTLRTAAALGLSLSLLGLALAWALSLPFGAVVTAGFAIDLGVYTAWLKRRTPFSIVLGGISGGMPALAGRVLALGRVDVVGILLALGVLLWIPAHILTLAMSRADEYEAAEVPTWPGVFGIPATRRLIAASTVAGTVTLTSAGMLLRIHPGALALLVVLGAVLSVLAIGGLLRPSHRHDWALFKAASVYMAASFGCLVVGAAVSGLG